MSMNLVFASALLAAVSPQVAAPKNPFFTHLYSIAVVCKSEALAKRAAERELKIGGEAAVREMQRKFGRASCRVYRDVLVEFTPPHIATFTAGSVRYKVYPVDIIGERVSKNMPLVMHLTRTPGFMAGIDLS